MEVVYQFLSDWYHALSGNPVDVSKQHIKRFKHDARILLQTIKLASSPMGGADTVAATIGKSLSMALPESMQESFLTEISVPGDELKEIPVDLKLLKKLPSAAPVRRYEFSVDLAILRLTRLRHRAPRRRAALTSRSCTIRTVPV